MVLSSLKKKASTDQNLSLCCTKAAHLEAVSDLTTEASTAALQTFISRRCLPQDLFSDNGSNFVRFHAKDQV